MLGKAEALKGLISKLDNGENLSDQDLKMMNAIKPHDVLGYSEEER